MESMPYAIFKDARVVRVKHCDLDKPWRARGTFESRGERDMKLIESVLVDATGLKRIYRSHNSRFGYVDFRLSQRTFGAASVALAMTYTEDEFWGRRLREYPVPSTI